MAEFQLAKGMHCLSLFGSPQSRREAGNNEFLRERTNNAFSCVDSESSKYCAHAAI